MPRLSPFPAIRYSRDAGEPADLLAPPYDVIDATQAESLRRRSEFNAVRLVLPEGEGEERYARAAARFERWLDRGILVEDAEPCACIYRQAFGIGNQRLERRGLVAALRLTPFGDGEVLPHEETHRGPREDRLALTVACRAQLSAIFMIAEDPEGALQAAIVGAEATGSCVLEGETADGVGHRLTRIPGPEGEELCRLAGLAPLLIADGHHRYETALEARRRLPDRIGADSVLACVVGERDPGLRVLPTHRSLRIRPPGGDWAETLAGTFELQAVPNVSPAELADRVAQHDGGRLACLERGADTAYVLRAHSRAWRAEGVPDERRRIATVAFDRLILARAFGLTADEAAERGVLSYHKDAADALRAAGQTGAAFLVPPLEIGQIRRSVQDGGRLPPKSTYFAPKVPSGLFFRRL